MPRVNNATAEEYGALSLIDLKAGVLLAGQKEVANVQARLKSDDVAAEQSFENCIAHLLGKNLPVLRRRPRHVHEVLDHRVWQRLPHQSWNQVQLVVLDHDQRPGRLVARNLDRLLGHQPVDCDVAVGPGLVDAVVDHRLVAEVPEIVLDEPQHGVGKHAVIHLVLLFGRNRVMQMSGGVEQRDRERRALVRRHLTLVIVARARDPLRLCRFGEGQQRGDHAAGSALEPTRFGIGLAGRAVAHQDWGAFGKRARNVCAHRRAGTAPLAGRRRVLAAPHAYAYRINLERSTGISRTRMPVALARAFVTAAGPGIAGGSPTPFAPSGPTGEGTSTSTTSMSGTWSAVGRS